MGIAEKKTVDDNESFLDELPPGTELLQGQYKIVKFLNSGGFGITYLASDSLDRKVVIKECFPSSFCNRSRAIVQARSRAHTAELRSVVQLFVQEARSLAKLNHPNIVGVHQVFEDNETAYMVLDFVEGRDLLDTLEDSDHGLTPPQIKGILKDVLGAVEFIHSQDILHRDISPDNILLDGDLRPVLIDFGAAREEATKKSRVLSAMRVVKDGYSPQEFYIQGSEQTPSSDLYALGATFYHLIAGEIPPNSQARLAAIASGEPDTYEPLAGRIKGYDTKFLSAIDTALGILPKDRMQSAEEWLSAMEGRRGKSRVVTQQVPMSSAAAASQAPKRSALVPLLGSVAVVAILAVGGLAFTGNLSSFGGDPDVATTSSASPDVTAPAAVTAQTEDVATPVEQGVAEDVAPVDVEIATPAAPIEITPAPEEVAQAAPVAPVQVAPEADVTTDADVAVAEAEVLLSDTEQVSTDVQQVTPAPAEVDPAPVEIAETEAPVAPAAEAEVAETAAPEIEVVENVTVEEAAPVVAEAEAPSVVETPVEIDAPQPIIADVPEAPVSRFQEVEAPVIAVDVVAVPEVRPTTPAAVSAAPAQDEIESVALAGQDIAAPAPVEVVEVASEAVSYQARYELPFEIAVDDNVITKTAAVAPVWVRPGARILGVNGVPTANLSDLNTVIANFAGPEDIETLQLSFAVKNAGEDIASLQSWTVPVKHETALDDGTVFVTEMINGDWQTKVVAVANNSELQVGDVIVAFVATSETISDHLSMRNILERELADGTNSFNFAVTREGSMWVVAMTYGEGA